MQDNSSSRRKTLIVSVLAFLLAGGGVFLFFIVQGSNDLTRAGKKNTFSYGEAAREGVSSFFKSVGVIPEDEEKLSQSAIDRNAERGLPLDELGIKDESPDVSDWMAKADQPRASASYGGSGSPTSVPKMEGRAGGVGGGSGGSKSSGGVSRFGEGSAEGTTSISNKSQAGGTGPKDKGTLASLKNTRALLGEGLRSDSAMTASAKWGQSFGVGSGSNRGGDMSYGKGMVGLDKIKSGEIADLKMDKKGGLKTTEVSSPVKDEDGTKKALQGDAKVQADAKKKEEDDMKKQAAQAAIDAAGKGMEKGASGTGTGAGTGTGSGQNPAPPSVMEAINKGTCNFECSTANGDKYSDASRDISAVPGSNPPEYQCVFKGEQISQDGTKITYTDTVRYSSTGKVLGLSVEEKAK